MSKSMSSPGSSGITPSIADITSVNCIKCNQILPVDAKFCPQCGTSKLAPTPITAPTCVKCNAIFPVEYANFCSRCGTPQSTIIAPTPTCVKCNTVLPVANAMFCVQCGEPQPCAINSPSGININLPKKSCLLCQILLPVNAQSCSICSAPQDKDVFRNLPTTNCINIECGVILLQGHEECYHCKMLQQEKNINRTPPSILQILTEEQLKAWVRQNEPALSSPMTQEQMGHHRNSPDLLPMIQDQLLRQSQQQLPFNQPSTITQNFKVFNFETVKEVTIMSENISTGGDECLQLPKIAETHEETAFVHGRVDTHLPGTIDSETPAMPSPSTGRKNFNKISFFTAKEQNKRKHSLDESNSFLLDGASMEKQMKIETRKRSASVSESVDFMHKAKRVNNDPSFLSTTLTSLENTEHRSPQSPTNNVTNSSAVDNSKLFYTDIVSDKNTTNSGNSDNKITFNNTGNGMSAVYSDISSDDEISSNSAANDDAFIARAASGSTSSTPVPSPTTGDNNERKTTPISDKNKAHSALHNKDKQNVQNESFSSYCPNLDFKSEVLNPEDDKAIAVEFNAVLPLKLWEWEDGKSAVYMRFGHPKLGEWKYDIGPGKLVRDAGDNLNIVRFELKLHHEFIKSSSCGMPYKYLVYSPRLKEKKNHPYEFLYWYSSCDNFNNNRLLKIIPKNLLKGRHRQFDTMILPQGIEKADYNVEIHKLCSVIKHVKQHDSKFLIPSPVDIHVRCMEIHLQPTRDILLTGNFTADLKTSIDGCVGLLKCIYTQYLECEEDEREWNITEVANAFNEWTKMIALELLKSESPCALVSGTFLICCLHKFRDFLTRNTHFISVELKVILIELIALTLNGKDVINFVEKFVQYFDLKNYLTEALVFLLRSVLDKTELEHIIYILQVLPLYHFMTDDSLKPYQLIRLNLKSIKWGDSNLGLSRMRLFLSDKKGFIDQHHDTLQKLVFLDSKFLYVIPYICPQQDTCRLCDIVPLDIAIAWIPESLSLGNSYSSSKLTDNKVSDLFSNPLACIQQKLNEDYIDLQGIKYCNDAAICMIEYLQPKLTNTSKNTMTFVTSTVKLMLCIIDKAKEFMGESDDLIREGMSKVQEMLNGWIVYNDVIGGSFFGGSVRYNGTSAELKKEHQELQIWESLLNIATESVDVITEDMRRDLENIILSLVDERVSKISPVELKIDVFINVESRENYPDAFRNIFLVKAIEALDELVMKKDNYNIRKWDEVIKLQSHRIVCLVSKILEKKYSKTLKTHEIPFDDLLEWGLWPGFITIYTSQSQIQSESEYWQSIVACAVSMFEGVCGRIHSGDITVDELQHIKSHLTQMNKLCDAINNATQSAGPQASLTHTSELHKSMELRLKELEYFTGYMSKLKHLITHVGTILSDHDDFLKQLQVNLQKAKINCLCHTLRDGSHKVICFPFAEHLEYCLNDFYIMSHVHSSDTFNMFWRDRIVSMYKSSISVAQVDTLLWNPVFARCNKLLYGLRSKELKLSEVDALFKQRYKDNHIGLIKDLESLQLGANACKMAYNDGLWIGIVVKDIEQYWDLCNYCEAAQAFIKIRDALKLTGDFSVVERVAKQTSTSQRNQALSSIDEKIVETGKFLHEYASDYRKRNCLEAFAECQEIVEWIKEVAKDVPSLLNFVTIALATAAGGEGDMATDKLSYLRTVGSGFGPLIYKLKKTAGYIELQEHCKTLWETLERAPDLPHMMRTCEEEIEWYKLVKETQGSVEVTSFGQMYNINEYGYYKIGSSKKGLLTNRADGIRLELRQSKTKRIHKLNYTLDDVRDLESKLVLITGQDSDERKGVDLFLDIFHCVCRITDVLMSLQQHGNDTYIGWTMRFSCCMSNVVFNLQSQASKMEEDLKNWQAELLEKRKEFYELNYFTTPQLLSLREELGKYKRMNGQATPTQPIKAEVMSLVQCISRDVTIESVKNEIQIVSGILQKQTLALSRYNTRNVQSYNEHQQDSTICNDMETQDISHQLEPSTNVPLSDDNASLKNPGFSMRILRATSSSKILQPSFKEVDLTDKQKAVVDNLIRQCGFSKKLIYLAFERCAKPNLEDAVRDWCNENEANFDFSDSEGDSDANSCKSSDEDDDHSIDEEYDVLDDYNEQFTPKEQTLDVLPSRITAKVKYVEITPINEKHPVVKKLMELGFDLEESAAAAEQYPDDSSGAMEYLMLNYNDDQVSDQDGLSSPSSFEMERQTSNEYGRGSPDSDDYETDIVINKTTSTKAEGYLTILELGMVLQQLTNGFSSPVSSKRPFSEGLKVGEPNLLVTNPDQVLKTVLLLYMEDVKLPLPTYEEVLICNKSTTSEEVTLLWRRAVGDPNHFRIFCLVHAELLSYQIFDKALKSLQEYIQGQKECKIVVVCSNENENKSHMFSKLQLYKRQMPALHSDAEYSQYLKSHFTQKRIPSASEVDIDNCYVRVVRSDRTGMGKSLYIQRLKERLRDRRRNTCDITIPVHGPKVTSDSIIHSLLDPIETGNIKHINQPIMLHLDIAQNVLRQVDSILFSLVILQGISDSKGKIWRCYPAHFYAIETTVLKNDHRYAKPTVSLLNILPTIICPSPREVYALLQSGQQNKLMRLMDEGEFSRSAFQRVFQYLRRHQNNIPLDKFSYMSVVEGRPVECLDVLLRYSGVRDPSWSEMRHFVEFLDKQLNSCESSIFCKEEIVGDVMSGLKTFVVKFMIRMSEDFATSSLKGEVAAENLETENNDELQDLQIVTRKQWEQNYHPYLFFNQDGMSITFVGFNVTHYGDLNDPVKGQSIECKAMSRQLYAGLLHNRVNLSENYQSWDKGTMIEKISMVMGLEWSIDPDPSYVLTIDNVIKILAIYMRFRCNIPVVIMGETGCGKTRLIKYMCDMAAQGCSQGGKHVKNMLTMKVHGGTTEEDIMNAVKEAEEEAIKNIKEHKIDTILFFDEANTTEAIGLIKEVMCDRRIQGRQIQSDIKFIAACNPYRKHTDDMIKKLESAGLGFYVKATETQQKLGKIPLRQLVYRVLDLPPSMRPLVYDFGQLNNETEKDYTRQIVKDRCSNIPEIAGQAQIINSVADVLAWSQKYMRDRKDECSFVSLRDVERAMMVFKYFCGKKYFDQKVNDKANEEKLPAVTEITRSLILTVSVCYHARLQDRIEYERGVVGQFKAPLGIPGGVDQFSNEIRWCQEVLLDNMKLGQNIARNGALRENVFMMAICIELRIPLFLVGKPGSSKSLAKSIVANSMLGRTSEKELMREFKEVHMFSYQCSQLSTPESVIEVFNTAKSFQKKQDKKNYVSVVVLDEVGLAEDSPNLPLKTLHPLLEDGTERADDYESELMKDRENRVAFIGISNWALDPAKMNRGVMVTRGDPDKNELELSAKGICSNRTDDPVKKRLSSFFKPLSAAYKEICNEQKKIGKAFFGLRDFYSLIKMLYWMCERSNKPPTGPQLQHAIKRNFGGLEDINTYEIFKKHIPTIEKKVDLSTVDKEEHDLLSPDCTPLGLIRKSLQTKETSWHGETRYLLFLTENYAALQVLKHYLHEEVGMKKESEGGGLEESSRIAQPMMEPFVLFGSSFPKDREYTQVCRNINQIKICMETGRTVILLNLENLYESLYDLLNLYYIQLGGGQRYVDLGLQTHRVKCRVHNDFKLILIAEKSTVYEKFPTPLINRLEKHFVLTETVLKPWQKDALNELTNWINDFTTVNYGNIKFTKQDAFVGYQNDTPSSVIFQATEQVMVELHDEEEGSEKWKLSIGFRSKMILLQMASPDALIRLERTALHKEQKVLQQLYFNEQHHGSITQFLDYHLHKKHTPGQCGLLIQVTTHSHLLSSAEVDQLCCSIIDSNLVLHFLLQEFDTEMDFSHKVSPAFSHKGHQDSLLIIQCDSGHVYGDLIACARYRIDDMRAKINLGYVNRNTHVLFIVHLPRQFEESEAGMSTFVGFQGGAWISAHIDDIRAPIDTDLKLDEASSAPISKLFYNKEFLSHHSGYGLEEMEVDDEHQNMESLRGLESEVEHLEKMEIENELSNEKSEEMEITPADENYITMVEEESESESEYEYYDTDIMEVYQLNKMSFNKKVEHNQCHRLRSCIQGAVAKLIENNDTRKEWTAQRVKLLLSLIPQHPTYPLNDCTFYGALVKSISRLLKEREEVTAMEKDWVLNEALSARKLQSGGTFQNVLTRRLDEVITPIFAAILFCIDQYSNLNLIKKTIGGNKLTLLQQLWIDIFRDERICQFDYTSFSIGKNIGHNDNPKKTRGQVLTTKKEFACQFPFFWLIKDAFESQWEAAKVTGGDDQYTLHKQLCDILSDTPIASVLVKIPKSHHNELYQCYLNDLIRSVHYVSHHKANDEHEIIVRAIDAIVTGPEFIRSTTSFVSLLAAVHVVYHNCQQEIMWFGQLTTHIPGILVHLSNVEYDPQCMRLQLQAVEVAIANELKIPLDVNETEDKQYIPAKLVKLHLCQNTVDSILSLPSSSNPFGEKIRCSWQHVRGIQLFVEHIVMKFIIDGKKYGDLVKYGKRIEVFMDKCGDFTQVETINKVQTVLRAIDRDISSKKLNYLSETQRNIRGYCKSYFMEVVSSLCFGLVKPPETPLIRELLNVVFTEKNETQEFSYSDKVETDKVPVVRSFLLRLLLEHNINTIREHLDEYFMRSRKLLKNDRNLFLLCIQCFEDALYKKHNKETLNERVKISHRLLKHGIEVIMKNDIPSYEGNVSLEYLKGIAKIRYSIMVVCELIHHRHIEKEKFFTSDADCLLDLVKKCCEMKDERVNSYETGAAVFLVKQMARKYGTAFITKVISDQMTMEWIVPEHLRRSNEVQEPQTNDVFVIYPSYQALRNCLTDAVYGEDLTRLQETTVKTLTVGDSVPLILGVYQVVTGSRVYTNETKVITKEISRGIDGFVKNCKILNRELMWIGQYLIDDIYCGRLKPMLRPGMNRILTDLMIHMVVTIQNQSRLDILNPFFKMINSPGELKNSYLPTMPEDYLPMARAALRGIFYECPQGHPYFVTECGRPMVNYACPQCGSKIGGVNHKLDPTNRTARINDSTETGYALGLPSQREVIATSERDLNPPSCAIVRALMHGCLLWASCTDENATVGLLDLIKSQVRPHDMHQFFWHHLEHDINILSKAIGKSTDEACLIIHLILKGIAITAITSTGGGGTLQSRGERINWEKSFSSAYIQPILNNLDNELQKAINLQLKDKKEDRLFYAIHEKVSIDPKAILPHLWTYHSRITLEHLSHALQTKKSTCPILDEFLKQEPLLRATKFIPGIVKLQQQMFEVSHRQLDESETTLLTIGDFILENISKGGYYQSRKDSFMEKLNCVRNAWKLVKDKLKEHSRVPVDPEYISVVTWDESTPLSFIIPTPTGHGACTVALIDLLVGVHNDFIEKCHSQLKKNQKKDIPWKEHKVPVSQIQNCHLLDYEQHLLSIVMSHCQYSLEYGKGQNVTYDYPALEKNIIDRFIHGKPLIQLEILHVTYRKDVYTAQVFANIRKNVSPQVKLTVRQQKEIVTELRSMQSLRECLDVIEIVIGFLSSGPTNSSTELNKYIKKVLKMDKKFTSKKAMEYCTLGHVLSLWETISVQMAKLLTYCGQEPFDSLDKDFHVELNEDQRKDLTDWLRGIELMSPFLNILYEFIETNVRHREQHEIEWTLLDTLVAHLESYGLNGDLLPGGLDSFEGSFPPDITIRQTIATWKIIVMYQKKYEHEINNN